MDFTRDGDPKKSINIGNPLLNRYPKVIPELIELGFVKYNGPPDIIIKYGKLRDPKCHKRIFQYIREDGYLFDFFFNGETDSVITDVYSSTIASRSYKEGLTWDRIDLWPNACPMSMVKLFKKYLAKL